jgi:hypothetical protein
MAKVKALQTFFQAKNFIAHNKLKSIGHGI